MLNHPTPAGVRIVDNHEVSEGQRRTGEDEASSFIFGVIAECRTVIDLADNEAGGTGKAPALLARVRPAIGLQLIDNRIEEKFIGRSEDTFGAVWEKESDCNGFRLIGRQVCGMYDMRVTLHRDHQRESGSGTP